MNLINKHLDKNNLHHAYLIEGKHDEVVPEIIDFIKDLGIKTTANSDFIQISLDSFKIEDARNLKSFSMEKSFSSGKKIFIISANNFLLEAQNTLLKMFEEPIENTHFFLIVPDTNSLLKTLISRFYFISARQDLVEETKDAEKFIAMPLRNRIDFIKDLLIESEEEVPTKVGIPTGVGKDLSLDSTRSKALKFLNALEITLHKEFLKNYERCGFQPVLREGSSRNNFSETLFEHFFKVREFLRMPGSSIKSLMESVALVIPNFLN